STADQCSRSISRPRRARRGFFRSFTESSKRRASGAQSRRSSAGHAGAATRSPPGSSGCRWDSRIPRRSARTSSKRLPRFRPSSYIPRMKAKWRGQVIADSDKTIEVGGYHYFPRDAVRMDMLELTPKTASDLECPHGVQFYDVKGEGTRSAR